MDNEIHYVYYNNQDITSKVTGNRLDWGVQKVFSFSEVAGASLAISGYNAEDSGCQTGGFSIICTSTVSTSVYNGLTTDTTHWSANGWSSEVNTATLLSTGYSGFSAPCVSTSGYSLAGVSPQPTKLWASNGLRYGAFRFDPNMVTCLMTIDNEIHYVYYNNQDITSKVTGNRLDWGSQKVLKFVEVSGATLAISGYNLEDNGCQSGGFSITCTSNNPRSPFNGLSSDQTHWKANGWSSEVSSNNLISSASGFTTPCVSQSGFSLSGVSSQPTKLWASNGLKYAAFRYN